MSHKQKLVVIAAAASMLIVSVAVTWIYAAKFRSRPTVIGVPHWLVGGSNYCYAVAVGRDQVTPFWTTWKTTRNGLTTTSEPMVTDEEILRYVARKRRQ